MKITRLIWLILPGLITILLAGGQDGSPQQKWYYAKQAMVQEDYDTALRLYLQVLTHCKKTGDISGEVNSLEALAIVYKKQHQYRIAKRYCRKSLQTGAPTFRAYYLLAQIAYDDGRNFDEARRHCQEGLRRFAGNSDLQHYLEFLQREDAARSTAKVRKTVSRSHTQQALSAEERKVVDEMNLARKAPRDYARHLEALRPLYQGELLKLPGQVPERTHEGVKALDEAIAYLKSAPARPPLKIADGMSRAARDHAHDQGKSGKTGHIGGDESRPYERLERYGNWEGLSGENIAYGDDTARMIVIKLIIDDGVPSRGQRDNIFSPEFQVCGVAIGPHPVYRTMCVITYASGYSEE